MKEKNDINENYENYYGARKYLKVYPTEFVMRTFLQTKLPKLNMDKPKIGDKILEVGFGDGRNTVFLCEQGYDVYGIEITKGIIKQTSERMSNLGFKNFSFKEGRNSNIPYNDNTFNYILASHSCYYCDEGETLIDNMKEYSRVLKRDGYVIFSIIHVRPDIIDEVNIMNDSEKLTDGTYVIRNDPLGIRNGYRFHAFETEEELKAYLTPMFKNFSIGLADNTFYGVSERLFWVVCQVNK
ncbi:methyltransferase, type 11 [Desulfosarcina variabilis str. Montpellier]|uniref:class I SAM-dependent methyltransferase n=1 Tax=Desulfosarcina variabilis TaxID=2300 RepID=UPI003AFB3117